MPIFPQPKEPRGKWKAERRQRREQANTREARNKTKVRKRDGHCRWPHASVEDREACAKQHSEVAHLTHKGIGGDPATVRSVPELMIHVCATTHQGPRSLHSGDLRVLYLTPEQADGPCAFLERVSRAPLIWREVGRELWPGMLAPVKERI